MASILKRAPKQWQAKIRRAGYPSKTATFETKKEAEAWARDIERDMDKGVYINTSEAQSITLRKVLNRYLTEITPGKKGAKNETYRINAWLKHPLANRPLINIRGVDMAEYRDQRLKDGMSPSTIRNDINVISHVYNIARKEWGIEGITNPVEHVRMPKQDKGRNRRITLDEEKSLIDGAESPFKEIIILAIESGMRRGELMTMTWEMVDLGNRVVSLEDTKNGERRSVPLSTKAVITLEDLTEDKAGLVFVGLSIHTVTNLFKTLCTELKIKNLRFHDLRHEATSRFFEKGFNTMEVSSITGHKTLHMLKRYTHLKAEDLAKRLG